MLNHSSIDIDKYSIVVPGVSEDWMGPHLFLRCCETHNRPLMFQGSVSVMRGRVQHNGGLYLSSSCWHEGSRPLCDVLVGPRYRPPQRRSREGRRRTRKEVHCSTLFSRFLPPFDLLGYLLFVPLPAPLGHAYPRPHSQSEPLYCLAFPPTHKNDRKSKLPTWQHRCAGGFTTAS